MAFFQWEDSYSVKIKEIDDQHKVLVGMIAKLHEALSQGKGKDMMGVIVNELVDYSINHFSLEEKYMQTYGYPNYTSHKKEHYDFINKIDVFRSDFQAGKIMLSLEVMNFLKDWLTKHIMGVDQQYSMFFREKGLK